MVELLTNLNRRLLASKGQSLFDVERVRAGAISADELRADQPDAQTPQEKLLVRSQKFLKLVTELNDRMAQHAGPIYRIDVTDLDEELRYQSIQVVNTHDAPVDDGTARPLLEGEILWLGQSSAANPTHYTIRWPVFCDVGNFMAAVVGCHRQFVGSGTTQVVSLDLQQIDDDSSAWNQGLILESSDGRLFGACCDPIRIAASWPHPQLPLHRHTMDLVDGENVQVEVIRINTPVADILFDVLPADRELEKYVTIISHINHSEMIARLYELLGTRYSFTSQLTEALDSALARFPKTT